MKSRKEKLNKVQSRCNLQTCQKEASKKCSRCRCVFYCDKSCQTQDWPVHKSNCKANNNIENGKTRRNLLLPLTKDYMWTVGNLSEIQ